MYNHAINTSLVKFCTKFNRYNPINMILYSRGTGGFVGGGGVGACVGGGGVGGCVGGTVTRKRKHV